MGFAVTADYRMKIKEREKRNKYLELTRELKKLWNMWIRVIPIVTAHLERFSKPWKADWKGWTTEE